MKKLLIVLVSCLLLTGCQGITFSVEDLLASPVIADEQTAIFKALTEGLGKSITLEYPYSGEYRSAIIIENIDGDEGDEALAFYTETLNESSVDVAVLDKDENGQWSLRSSIHGAGNAIDKVIIHHLNESVDVIIGYRVSTFDENRMMMYRYTDDYLISIYDSLYTSLERFDLDGDERDEIVIAGKSGDLVSIKVIKSPDGTSYLSYELPINHYAPSIASAVFGKIGERQSAIYVDLLNEDSALSTEIVYLDNELITCPTNDVLGLRASTRRPNGYASLDYDGDGIVEIPLVSGFTGYSQSLGQGEFMTMWHSYNPSTESLELESNSYYSVSGSFVLTIPNRWMGFVTVVTDTASGEATFYKYDPSIEKISDMSPIMSVVSAYEHNADKYSEDAGYKLIKQTDRRQYFIKQLAEEGEPLMLTNDEILDNLFCLE